MLWQICPVFLFSCGSLLCLAVGESPVYKSGVQHDVPLSSLVAAGCVPCYEAPYGSVSKSQDITSCTGPYLFVGTQIGDKQALEIGALTTVEVLRTESTRSEPYLSNGVCWHFMKGCSFGFMAVEYDDDSIESERPDFTISASLSREVTWSIDQSIGCSSYDGSMTHSIVDTSSWTKHVHNCPGHTALGLFSEKAGGAGGREGEALNLSQQSLSTYGDGAVDRYVILASYPIIYTTSTKWIYADRDMLQAAIRETVKVITNINDIVVSLIDGPVTTNNYVRTGVISKYTCYVTLRESKSLVALQLLRNSTFDSRIIGTIKEQPYYWYDKSVTLFSRTMSKKLNATIYAEITYWDPSENKHPPTSSPLSPSFKPTLKPASPPRSSSKTRNVGTNVIIAAVVAVTIACIVLYRLFFPASCASRCGRGVEALDVFPSAPPLPSSLPSSPSPPLPLVPSSAYSYGFAFAPPSSTLSVQPVITVIATQVSSAQATLISSEEASMYETATAEVTSNIV